MRDYLQERYGDFVLYDPPFKPETYLLWLGPVVLFALALIAVWRTVRRARAVRPSEPDDATVARVLADLGVAESPDVAAGKGAEQQDLEVRNP